MRYIFLFLYLLNPAFGRTQSIPVKLWQSTEFINSGGSTFPKVRFDKFGNIYTSIGFQPMSSTNINGRLIKYDTSGNVLWRFNTPSFILNWIGFLSVDSFGNSYAGVHYMFSIGPLYDHNTKVYKLSPTGEVIWEKRNEIEYPQLEGFSYSELSESHGSLIIAGGRKNENVVDDNYYFIQALDTIDGSTKWRTILSGQYNFLYNGKLLPDRIILFFVRVKDDGTYYVVAHIDYEGNILGEYEHMYASASQYNDISCITKTGDILLGNRGTGYNVAKLDIYGDTLWTYSLNTPLIQTPGSVYDICEDIFQNVYCTGGSIMENDTMRDYITTKLDANGNVIWQNTYQLEPQSEDVWDEGTEIATSSDYIVTFGKSTVLNEDNTMAYPPVMHIHSPNWSEPLFTLVFDSVYSANTRNLFIVGDKIYYQLLNTVPGTLNDVNEITGCIALPQTSSTHTTLSPEGILIFPTPTVGQITFSKLEPGLFEELCVIDMKGQVLDCMEIDNQEQISLSLSKYPAGTYVVSLKGKKGTLQKKVIKQ